MSVEIVKSYAEMLASAMKNKDFAALLSSFSGTFNVHANIMGKEYNFTDLEKLQKFLTGIPSGVDISINKITEEAGIYTVKTAMGMGFMKLPGKWTLELDSANKIKSLDIK